MFGNFSNHFQEGRALEISGGMDKAMILLDAR